MMAHILIVDDNLDSCEMLIANLRRLGHSASCASSGKQALDSIAGALPDVVLLDVMMPDMSGLDVLDHIRADPDTSSLPVVMFSALDDLDMQEKALSRGADGYWVKGHFDFRGLRQGIEQHVR